MDRRIYFLKNRLACRLNHRWKIREMADELGLSVSHFQKLFKNEVGTSPIAFLRECRLESARQLLAERPTLRIKEIGFMTGLTNGSHFTRDFKTRYGVSPSEYRRGFDEPIAQVHGLFDFYRGEEYSPTNEPIRY